MLDSSVRLAYEEKGRIRVVFPKIETAKSADNDGIDVAVTVEEGPAYKLGDVSFKGVTSREAPELNKLGNWAKDAVVNFAEIDSGIRRIQKSFREDGYLRVETPIARVVHDDTKTVDLTITIQPGPRFNMGKLTIKGLDILSEPAIRKAWRMNEGDAYKESYPDAFLAMIQSEGYFDNLARTGAEADLHEDTHKVDVTLTFLGAKAAAAADKKLR
jgi:outer membrane protein assembly factor BamA